MKSVALALCTVLLAPYQCGTRTTKRPVEDTAPQALWTLAERFEQNGDSKARELTLHQLAEQYPKSRFGKRARIELGMPVEEANDKDDEPEAEAEAEAEESTSDEAS